MDVNPFAIALIIAAIIALVLAYKHGFFAGAIKTFEKHVVPLAQTQVAAPVVINATLAPASVAAPVVATPPPVATPATVAAAIAASPALAAATTVVEKQTAIMDLQARIAALKLSAGI